MRARQIGIGLLTCLLLACLTVSALADVVYLKNGKTLRGSATREGDLYVVRTALGVRRIAAKKVLYVSRSDDDANESTPDDANDVETPKQPKLDPDKTTSPYRKSDFSAATASQPESIVFSLMRATEAGSSTAGEARLKSRILVWQRHVKDRQRRLDSRWVKPEEFIRRRKAVLSHIADAEEEFSKAKRSRGRDDKSKARRKHYERAGYEKMRLAAAAWTDPALRYWLQGVAALKSEKDKSAQTYFGRAVKENPYIAGFYQGLAKARIAQERALPAVTACMTLLQLRPEDREAVQLMERALKKVPGSAVKHPTYLAARALFKQYPPDRYRRRSSSWLMPDKDIRDDKYELPIPEYDRIAVRQGTGVAVSDGALIIDRSIARRAVGALVQIDPNTIVPAEINKRSIFGRRASSDVPLAVIEVPGVKLTPVKIETEGASFKRGTVVKTFALESWEEMGEKIYPIGGQITGSDANGPTVSVKLAPGDAAAAVLTKDNRLVGFLKGRTDPLVKAGGPNRFFSLSQAESILRRGVRYDADPYSRRKAELVAVKEPVVKVYLLVPERFRE